MKSISENTIGKFVASCEEFVRQASVLQPHYLSLKPEEDLTIFRTTLDDFKAADVRVAATKQVAKEASAKRRAIFKGRSTEPNTILFVASGIKTAAERQYGTESTQVQTIQSAINSLHPKASKKSSNSATRKYSTSKLSYDSMLETFVQLVGALDAMSPAWAPAQPNYTITALNDYVTFLTRLNTDMNTADQNSDLALVDRNRLGLLLTKMETSIKIAMKDQYGKAHYGYKEINAINFVWRDLSILRDYARKQAAQKKKAAIASA